MRIRVTEWIKENGISPTNEPTWGDEELIPPSLPLKLPLLQKQLLPMIGKASSESALNDADAQKIAEALLEAFQMIPR